MGQFENNSKFTSFPFISTIRVPLQGLVNLELILSPLYPGTLNSLQDLHITLRMWDKSTWQSILVLLAGSPNLGILRINERGDTTVFTDTPFNITIPEDIVSQLHTYFGPGILLPSLFEHRKLRNIGFLERSWSDVTPFIAPNLNSSSLELVETLDLAKITIISHSNVAEIACLIPRIAHLVIGRNIPGVNNSQMRQRWKFISSKA
ncbi:hypothetical protein M422DRAFT_277047 [Sphaerobolus stellatus SS14]|uniref:Uncharacterized protein n=1 Tax=Sphaerobolus stellatus (strain SS14) TaxID=990650 RepID=A0A0C9TKX7_SPHS4|nr:hypothetical protein M422DRAFT_277047 [Sphaerobolus stellatus SS14]